MKTSRFTHWISRLAPIYPGEGAVVGLCFAVNFLVIAGIMFGRSARDSLFLFNYDIQFLPYMYLANAVVLVVCSVFYTSLVDRMDRGRFLGSVSLIFVALLVGSRVVLAGQPHWFYPVLYILAQGIWNFSLLQFWTFLGDLFDTRQAKRLFPVIAVGSLLGMIASGMISRPLVNAVGTENLLLVWGGLILSALVLGAVVYTKYRTAKPPAPTDASSSVPARRAPGKVEFSEGFSRLKREPLLRALGLVTFLLWTVFTVVDFCFNMQARETYPLKNDLTAFLGSFRGWAGLICLGVQVFLTSTLISRLGVGATINFHPAFLTLATLGMTARFGNLSVFAAKMGDHVLLYTVQDSSFQLLYNAVPLERRARIRALIDGFIKPASMAAAGILLLLGTKFLNSQQISLIGFVLAFTWLVAALTAKKGYIRALLENLQADSPAIRQAAASALGKLRDPSSLGVLAKTLESERPERVVAAVQILETFGTESATDTIAGLLNHSNPHVRASAAGTLGRRGAARHVGVLTELLADSDSRVRANAVEALAVAKDPALLEKIRPLLGDPSTRARINTVLTLAALQGASAAVEWLPMIRDLAKGDRDARSTAAYALGRLPLDESMNLLSDLLGDRDVRIRSEAALALGRIGTSRVIPALTEALAGPLDLRRQARRSIVAILGRCDGVERKNLEHTALSSPRPEIRSELADVLGRLKDPQVIETLGRLLTDSEWRVRWKVLKSFERLARAGALPESARTALFDYAHKELAAFRESLRVARALVPSPERESEKLLSTALQEDRRNIEERVFNLLRVLCGREKMQTIFQKLRAGDTRGRADALEALDNLAPKQIARQVLEVLEPPPAAPESASAPVDPILAALAAHSKPWVRACTAAYLGEHAASNGQDMMKSLLRDPDPAVRQTALYSGWIAFENGWQAEVESAARSSDPALYHAAQKIRGEQARVAVRAGFPVERGDRMLLTIEKVVFLKSAPLFAGLEGEELAAIADIAIEYEYPPGEVIFEQGQPAHHLYVLAWGKVEIFLRADSGERPLALLGERECFGEMAILDDLPRSASVRALEQTLVLKIDRESFRELIHERPQIAFAIFKILSGRLRHQNLEADHVPAVYAGGQYA